MGFYEDDRIRKDNYIANVAYSKFEEFKNKKLSNSDILCEIS